MTVPERTSAAAILLDLQPPTWLVRHSRAVAEVAGWLARAAERRGETVNRRLVESAGLLHDVDKILGRDDPASALPHGDGSAAWLTRMGAPELAAAVASHPVTRLADGAWFEWFLVEATLEQRIVAYADKRARQHLVSLDERFAEWDRRHSRGADAAERAAVRERADRLERSVCQTAGVRPRAVSRLHWTAVALRRARAERRAA